MSSEKKLDCCIVGNGTLAIECAQLLIDKGHTVLAVVSQNFDVIHWAEQHGIKNTSTDAEQASFLSQNEFDYLFNISNADPLIKEVFNLPRKGVINFSDAPYPSFAGLQVGSKAIRNQQASFGVMWHELVEPLRAGRILKQAEIRVDADENAFSLDLKCFQKGLETFAELVGALETDAQLLQLDPPAATDLLVKVDRPLSAAVINWSQSAKKIEAFVRSLSFQTDDNLLGVPKVLFNDKFYLVTNVSLTNNKSQKSPGTFVAVDSGVLEVATGEDNLLIHSLLNLDGDTVDIASLKGFAAGQCFTVFSAEIMAKITEKDSQLAKNESRQKNILLNVEPASLEAFGALPTASLTDLGMRFKTKAISTELQDTLLKEFPALPLATVLAGLYSCFLRRILDAKSFAIGLNFGQQRAASHVAALLSARIPFHVEIDSGQSVRVLIQSLFLEFEEEKEVGSYWRDLHARTHAINAVHFPVMLEIVDELPQATDAYTEALVFSIQNNSANYQWSYKENVLDDESAIKIFDKFEFFLQQALNNNDAPLSEVHLIAEDEKNTLLVEWNKTGKPVDYSLCVHQLFENQVKQRPDAIAIAFRDQEISYTELNRQANHLAEKLRHLGAQPDSLIGIFIERSIEMVVGLLAIQKAGSAYVPLDPAYPRERITLMLSDSEAEILLSHSSLENELPASSATVLCIDKELQDLPSSASTTNDLVGDVTSNNLAYAIYTSGSTGTPKGVLVEHRNVLNFMSGMDDSLDYNGVPGVWLAVTSISFDISVLELFWSLTRGFKVVLQEEEARTIGVSQKVVSKVDKKLDIGLFYFSSDAGPNTSGNRYKLLMEGAKFADTHNFSAVWTPERHFHLFGGLYPNPSVTSAAVAAITNNVSLRAGSIVLPLHNTIRVAEEWSVVDNLSNGRVGLSIASGWHVNDFALKPENFKDRRQIMFDEIETIRKLWRGESIEVLNGEGESLEVKIYPPSIQKEPPIWVTTAGNIETFRQAGEGGFNVLTNLLGQSIDDLTSKIAAYREGRRLKGFKGEGNVSCMVHTFVGTDVEEVRKIVKQPFCNYLKTSFDLVKIAPWAFPAFKQPSKAAAQDSSFDASSLTDEDMDALIDHAFDRYFETSGIFGTPNSVLPLVDQLKAAGIDEIACLIDFGVETDIVLDSLKHLSTLLELSNPTANSVEQEFSVASQISKHQVTHFQCTPSMARILASDEATLSALGSVQKMLLGGEALPSDLAVLLNKNLKGDLINVYGPTETTIWSTSGVVSEEASNITIGRPIANTKIYIVDSGMQPSPIGVPGELLIGGGGVVRGYHKRADLTAEKFIDNPLPNTNDPRVYRTGDLAKYRDNGEIEFLGRLDHQVKLRGYRIELGEIESLINTNAQVKESVVVALETEQGAQELYAYVVPNKAGLNQSTDHWQTIWDEAYQGNTAIEVGAEQSVIGGPTFNISGWLDSYTGEQHKSDHMQEWLDKTCDRILNLKPRRVLEIGCGTGMVLYRIAAQCEAYVGVDFSDSGLSMIAEQLPKLGINNVKLLQSAADSLTLENEQPFDLVIINSVCQYFPSADYFSSVLTKVAKLLSAEGNIFIGDVRSFALKEMFHTSLEVARSPASLTLSELAARIQEHHENESELLVDPDFFYNLDQKITAVNHVDIQLKRGLHRNEMSAYRYDVVLRLGAVPNTLHESDFQPAPAVSTLVNLQAAINSATGNVVMRDIVNARLTHDALSQGLLSQNSNMQLVSDLHREVGSSVVQQLAGIEPEAIYQLETGYQVQLVWARSGKKDCFDAYFFQAGNGTCLQLEASNTSKPLSELCYEPVQKTGGYELVDQLKAQLRDKLPEFMVPSEFIMLTAMPLTPNGKINRKALPSPEKRQRTISEVFVAPENDIEKIIAEVFQEMLNIEKIGTRDNFFSLGVNSLLIAQANNHLGQRLARKVSLVAMYRFPTIASLAEHLSGQSDSKASSEKGTARAEKRKAAVAARRSRRRKS